MIMYDINGEETKVDVSASKYPEKKHNVNSREYLVGQMVRDLYPFDNVLDQFKIPGSRMTVDFFLPKRFIAIEVQGQQHQENVPLFHGSKRDTKFQKQTSRDISKSSWCYMNDISLIEIFPKDTEKEINDKLISGKK